MVTSSPAVASEPVLVVVVGSLNLDIVIELDAAPQTGQTVLGTGYSEHGGGKGGNQAIAAARMARTAIIGALGEDAAGDLLEDNLRSRGIGTRHVRRTALPSGRAFITLTPDAENSIAVIPGANSTISAEQVTAALEETNPRVVIVQQEISVTAVEAAAAWATRNDRRLVLNASPARAVSRAVLAAADPLVVNASEARDILAGFHGAAPDADPRDLAERLIEFSQSVIVTAGARGAFVATRSAADGRARGSGGAGGAPGAHVDHITAEAVRAVDTTGAGDEFAGTVAAALAVGESLRTAAHRANAASARLVQHNRADR